MSSEHVEALLTVQRKLKAWNRGDNSPSETGYLVEDVQPGHPLHSAVAALQAFYDGTLPRPAVGYWRKFVRCSRNDDEDAEDWAEELLDWVQAEIKKARKRPRRKTPGRKVSRKMAEERQLVSDRFEEFKDDYKSLGFKKPSVECFAEWATDQFDDMPTDDPNELRKMLDAHRHTPTSSEE